MFTTEAVASKHGTSIFCLFCACSSRRGTERDAHLPDAMTWLRFRMHRFVGYRDGTADGGDVEGNLRRTHREHATSLKRVRSRCNLVPTKPAEREDKLRRTAEQMVYQKELMGGGRKRKLRAKELAPGTGAKANVHKWKRERKK